MSFTLKILTGLFLGVFTGLFLGEMAAPFSVAGEVFIGLLQMTVLPYIVVSLVSNLGGISWTERRGLLVSCVVVLSVMLLPALDILKFGYQSYDITDAFSEFWPRARESMLALKDDFESEGNGYICKHWLREANEEFLPAMEANELRRYLYIVRV
jgi:hypothetical protein